MSSIAQRLNQAYRNERARTTRVVVQTEIDGRWEDAATIMKSGAAVAMAIVGFILLIACANMRIYSGASSLAVAKKSECALRWGPAARALIRQLLTKACCSLCSRRVLDCCWRTG